MKKLKTLGVALLLVVVPLSNLYVGQATAATIAGETFTGVSTPANTWISGGTTGACLTAATTSAANSIPACPSGPLDTVGNGALRLTRNANSQSGFAIYNSPVSASQGLDISFDTFQYAGTGADGISFFLIDGSASPTQPGALGGSLGYSSSDGGASSGLVGGYVGVGFDRWGNFSDPNFGTNGPGRIPNSITVRGSEASGYKFVSTKAAAGALGVESASTRASAKRHVRITISTNNIMSVWVDYQDGQGARAELSNLNLNTVNGAGSLPANFKFGFSAGTGGSNNIHEIQGLTVDPLRPDLSTHTTYDSDFQQGETSAMHITVSNSAAAEPTTGLITVTETVAAGLTPLSASGSGWTCSINGQVVTCTRPGDGANALQPGSTTPPIDIPMQIGDTATGPFTNTLTVATPNNVNGGSNTNSTPIELLPFNDDDGVNDSVEAAAPNNGDANNDGDDDSSQVNVTSLPNPVTGKYAVLESSGDCAQNSGVSVVPKSSLATADGKYNYPAGLMNFTLTCSAAGDTATVTQYYYGISDTSSLVLRKYDAVNHTYQNIPNATLSIVTIGGQSALKAVYDLTDGGPLDQDGTANGVIVDPAGPALLVASAATTTTGSSGGSLVDTGLSLVATTGFACGLIGTALLIKRRRLQPSAPTVRKIEVTFID